MFVCNIEVIQTIMDVCIMCVLGVCVCVCCVVCCYIQPPSLRMCVACMYGGVVVCFDVVCSTSYCLVSKATQSSDRKHKTYVCTYCIVLSYCVY